jgi:hypothetical protein
MVEYAGRFATVVPLTWSEQGVCFVIGSFSLLWGVVTKLIMPPCLFDRLAISEKPMSDDEAKASFIASMRRSYRHSAVREGI